MTSIHRFRKSDPQGVVRLPVDSAQVIEVGDMVFLNTDDVRAADQFAYVTGNLDGTQANFAAKFLGIAMTASASGETDDISIATKGSFEMACAAATFEIGDLVGPDDNAAPDALLNQQVIAIGENGMGPIGRVVKRYSANTTSVVIELVHLNLAPVSAFMPLFKGLYDTAIDLVTDRPIHFPFKAVRLHSHQTILGAGVGTISLHKGAQALDDTLVIADGAPIGAYDVAVLDDATGDDIFLVGDTLSLASDGTATAGEALIYLEYRPYVLEA